METYRRTRRRSSSSYRGVSSSCVVAVTLAAALWVGVVVQSVVADHEGVSFGAAVANSKYFRHMAFPNQQVEGVVSTERRTERTESHVMKVELVHRDQLDSSADFNGKSVQQRFVEAVERSHERAAHLTHKLSPETLFNNRAKDMKFQSPVSAGNGEYLMSLTLGTPPQKFQVIVDTGSDLNWVQCTPCKLCYQQPGPKFDPSKSSSYRTAPCTDHLCDALPVKGCSSNVCQYQYTYGDQSNTNGDLAYETISLNNNGAEQGIPNFAFGCGVQNQGTFAGAGGLVGLGQGPLSLNSQLSATFANKFSYCLVSLNSAASSALSFGSVAATAGIQYTPILANPLHPTYYYIQMTGISVGGQDLHLAASVFALDQSTGRGGTIIDSGTTITMLTLPAYSAVLKAYQTFITYPTADGSAYGLDLCFNIAGVANPRVPDMVFKFQGADFQLLAENLFVLVDNSATTLCLAMGGSQGFSIIGNIQQQNHLVIYDLEAKKIGFGVAKC